MSLRQPRSTKINKFKFGFTLIELLVVVSIIGLLASIVLVSLNSARVKARDARRLADIKQIMTAMDLYYDANGQYPASGGATSPSSSWSNSNDSSWATLQTALVSYLAKLPIDPKQSSTGWSGVGDYTYAYYAWNSCNLQGFILVYNLEQAIGSDPGVSACDATFLQYGGTGGSTSIKTVGERAQ